MDSFWLRQYVGNVPLPVTQREAQCKWIIIKLVSHDFTRRASWKTRVWTIYCEGESLAKNAKGQEALCAHEALGLIVNRRAVFDSSTSPVAPADRPLRIFTSLVPGDARQVAIPLCTLARPTSVLIDSTS